MIIDADYSAITAPQAGELSFKRSRLPFRFGLSLLTVPSGPTDRDRVVK